MKNFALVLSVLIICSCNNGSGVAQQSNTSLQTSKANSAVASNSSGGELTTIPQTAVSPSAELNANTYQSDYVTRSDYGQRLEPVGNFIIPGAGQTDLATFLAYSNSLPTNARPELYMAYIDMRGTDLTAWCANLLKKLNQAGPYVIPQIGIAMYNDLEAQGADSYVDDVANGRYDANIVEFVTGLKNLHRPVYIRIGNEMNGFWTGYDPQGYIKAFRHITDMIRGLDFLQEVATVWDVTLDTTMNASGDGSDYMQYYPGDEYVDWWGVNLFSREVMNLPVAEQFMLKSTQGADGKHPHPVMIGESSPRGTGVADGQKSWDEWFGPYFDFIKRHANIKAISYIDQDWSAGDAAYKAWGDSRVQSNPVVFQNWKNEIEDPIYINQADEKTIRRRLGLVMPIANE